MVQICYSKDGEFCYFPIDLTFQLVEVIFVHFYISGYICKLNWSQIFRNVLYPLFYGHIQCWLSKYISFEMKTSISYTCRTVMRTGPSNIFQSLFCTVIKRKEEFLNVRLYTIYHILVRI